MPDKKSKDKGRIQGVQEEVRIRDQSRDVALALPVERFAEWVSELAGGMINIIIRFYRITC